MPSKQSCCRDSLERFGYLPGSYLVDKVWSFVVLYPEPTGEVSYQEKSTTIVMGHDISIMFADPGPHVVEAVLTFLTTLGMDTFPLDNAEDEPIRGISAAWIL
jgi:hypothetical protein